MRAVARHQGATIHQRRSSPLLSGGRRCMPEPCPQLRYLGAPLLGGPHAGRWWLTHASSQLENHLFHFTSVTAARRCAWCWLWKAQSVQSVFDRAVRAGFWRTNAHPQALENLRQERARRGETQGEAWMRLSTRPSSGGSTLLTRRDRLASIPRCGSTRSCAALRPTALPRRLST
jgi:hypothetical protein